MTEKEAYVAFNLTDRIGSVGVARLVEKHGSVAAAWEAYPDKTPRAGFSVDWMAEMKRAEDARADIITPADPEYPPQLKAASGHPLVLYVRGNVKALSMPSIAIVGTRRATSYGLDQAYRFGRDLAANGWVVISGLAVGIDAESHRGALAAEGGITIGVIGSGLNRFYPEKNLALAREIVEKGGAVVTEFPFGRAPDQKSFPQRNHVVAGLARGVIAVEAPAKSGTLITIGFAADLGRTVMAIPGRVDSQASSGCLRLIRDGATLVRSAADVEEELGGIGIAVGKDAVKARSKGISEKDFSGNVPLTREEFLVMREIDSQGLTLDQLVRKTGLDAANVNAIAMTLLIKGRIRFLPGNRVALPRE